MSSCPQVLCISGCWDSCIHSRIISSRWLPKCHHADRCSEYVETGASGRRYRNITWTCGRGWIRWWWQMRTPIEPGLGKEPMGSRQHNQWKAKKWDMGVTMVNEKRGIAAGHVRVVDYVSSRISAKVSCSLALPSPDNSFVCANSQSQFQKSNQTKRKTRRKEFQRNNQHMKYNNKQTKEQSICKKTKTMKQQKLNYKEFPVTSVSSPSFCLLLYWLLASFFLSFSWFSAFFIPSFSYWPTVFLSLSLYIYIYIYIYLALFIELPTWLTGTFSSLLPKQNQASSHRGSHSTVWRHTNTKMKYFLFYLQISFFPFENSLRINLTVMGANTLTW